MDIKPTESELEILQVLWSKGASTVREVNEQLAQQRGTGPGYTTTLKLMQIMHDKGIVSRDTTTRTHVYTALLSEESIREGMVDKMINTIFNGSATELVMQALNTKRSSAKELQLIRDLINQLDKK
ncbi:BlaI/MecI/CopY family transcriptional regulator [Hufsiella ginkgonis]|uniref:BlaI/MecI/CopY family transcriptional regulator n=1 Tax=Hufsiella ginkgonis TaxID=2695274 RepID=A0A7K1XUX3_9SPHI|nr:BlaI/MecI/CopY family transcriptional regulator [Hufsiella ginkgonis]MXV14770.1 BlaI/MecI/CopY family transcriptional regulator [Hufsiella ginkgonis]